MGGFVMFVLDLRERAVSEPRKPGRARRQFRKLAIGCLVVAAFLAWRTEHLRNQTFSVERPWFESMQTQLQPISLPGERVQRFTFHLKLDNASSRPASDFAVRLILAGFGPDAAPMQDESQSDANVVGPSGVNVRLGTVLRSADHPPAFVIFLARYTDSATNAEYTQQWFYKWGGKPANGDFVVTLGRASSGEKERILTYLSARDIK